MFGSLLGTSLASVSPPGGWRRQRCHHRALGRAGAKTRHWGPPCHLRSAIHTAGAAAASRRGGRAGAAPQHPARNGRPRHPCDGSQQNAFDQSRREGRGRGPPPAAVTPPASPRRHRLPWKLTSVAGAGRGAGQGVGLRRAGRWATAHRLAVTTETQARYTQPFLPLGTAGLASRAMAGGSQAPREAFCPSACLSTCPRGVEHPSA